MAKTGHLPFGLAMMLRIHCLQQSLGLCDLEAEEALFETSFFRDFLGIYGTEHIPVRAAPRNAVEVARLLQRVDTCLVDT